MYIDTRHTVSVARWAQLASPGRMSDFEIFSRFRPRSKFSNGETVKPTGDDMKIRRGELTNIYLTDPKTQKIAP